MHKVEGLAFPNAEQADVVAARFARRYGRDIAVCNAKDTPLYYITQTGRKYK